MSSPAATPALRPRRELLAWRNAVFAIFTLSGLSFATWVARVPAVRDDLGLTEGAIGLLLLGMSGGSILGLLSSAALLRRLGARRGMLLSLTLVGAGLILFGLGSTVFGSAPAVFLGLAVFGFGQGALDVMMNVEGAAAEKELGKTVLPLMHAFFSIGTVAGAGLGALAVGLGLSVAWHAAIMAVLVVAGTAVTVRFIPQRDPIVDRRDAPAPGGLWTRLRAALAVWADLRLVLIGLLILGMAFAEGSANDWLPLAAIDGHGLGEAAAALTFGLFTLAMTAGRVAGGPLIDRFGRVPVLRASALSAVVGLAMFIFLPGSWLALLGVVLWGLGASLGFPVGMSAAADDPSTAAARVSAVAVIGYLAFLAGPPLIGLLAEGIGLLHALLVVLVLLVVSGLCAPATRERRR